MMIKRYWNPGYVEAFLIYRFIHLMLRYIAISNEKSFFPCTIYPCPSTLMESFPNLIMNLTDEVTYCKILRKLIFLFVALDICGFVIEYFNGCSWNPNKVYLTVHLRDFFKSTEMYIIFKYRLNYLYKTVITEEAPFAIYF